VFLTSENVTIIDQSLKIFRENIFTDKETIEP